MENSVIKRMFSAYRAIFFTLVASALLAGCATMLAPSSDDLVCEGSAEYSLTFLSNWSVETHPESFPLNPHYSRLVGATHRPESIIWAPGKPATNGVKQVAEKGLNSKFKKEIDWAIKTGQASSYIDAPDMKLSPGKVDTRFTVSTDFPLVSVLSMIAPSPDWIVGASGLSMCENANWVLEKVVVLRAYDAGTDAGQSYLAKDKPEAEKQIVEYLKSDLYSINGQVPAFGELRFELVR